MRSPRMIQRSAIGIAVAAIAVAFCCIAIAADLSTDTKTTAVDAEQYADFIENEVFDIQDLAEGAEIQRRMFSRITPPGFSWLQPMFPPVVPFDATNFDDSFLDDLLGEDKNSVAIYPLSLALDPKSRETLVYNADGKLIATIPADKAIRYWPEDADPARVTLQLDLLPSEDVEQYLYTESRIDDVTKTRSAKSAKSGGMVLRSLGASEFGFADMRSLTNGTMQLTVSNGVDAAEIYSYTIMHTSATVIVTYTNEQSNVVTDTNTLWYPVSPPYSGIESSWESRTTNLLLTNGVGTWEDANVASNARVRFYAAAKRADGDVDGLTDGAEIFLHRTDPGEADTDEDGHSDGREIALETDPLDGSDYFGIVINAALPIPPPPGSEVGREWVELFNAGLGTKSLAGFRLQTALPSGWTNVYTFPTNTTLDSGDFMVIGNETNGDFQANLYLPNSSFTPPGVFGIRLVAPSSSIFVADALMYGLTNEYGFSLDGFGEELPILRPKTNLVVRRTWVGFDTDHAGDWKNVAAALWPPHTQGDYTDLDGDGLSNADEIASGVFPIGEGTRIDDTDTDADGVTDAEEAANGTNPTDVDTDGDAFPWSTSVPPRGNDGDEQSSGTDPLDYDSDNDGVPDGWELEGGLDPLSPDSDSDAMPDGDEDTDGDGIPNAEEVSNLTNPFLAADVDPRSYIWTKNGQDIGGGINEGDIGYGTVITYEIKAQSDCPPIMVHVTEGGYMVEEFIVSCGASLIWLNPEDDPPTNRYYCIVPGGNTNFTFVIEDGKTTWPNETDPEYGADISLENGPTGIDLNAGEPEPSEESVGIVIADRISHPLALRRQMTVSGPDGCGEYLTHVTLTYDTERLQVYDSEEDGNPIASGTSFPVDTPLPDMYLEGISPSEGMRDSWVEIEGDEIPVFDRVVVTVLKANIGTVGPMADATLHPGASRQPLSLPQTLPEDWNGIMALSVLGAQAYWTPTGGTPIVLGETVFTNLLLPQTVYLGDGACGEGDAKFSVIDLEGCWTNTPIPVFGVNATLAGVAELDEESPGGFIADRTTHTNAPRTLLTLYACGPAAATGTVSLSWNSSLVEMYTAPTGGTALASLSTPFDGFSGTNLYVEGIAPGICNLSWSYSEQSECEDNIQITVLKIMPKEFSFTNNHTIRKDDSSLDYTAPHWQDNSSPLDGDADDAGDKKCPICFTRNTNMQVSAFWHIEPANPGVSIKIHGDGPGNLDFPETVATISGNDLSITNVACSYPFADEVNFFDPMSIAWSFSVDDGAMWCNSGTSANQTYVTLGNPLTTVFHTLAHLGCMNADGENTATGCTEKIWSEFTDRDVRRVDNVQLTYYASYLCTNISTADLLKHGDGQCGSWARFFIDMRKVQGIDEQDEYVIFKPIYDDGFIVKNWSFTGNGTSGHPTHPYINFFSNYDALYGSTSYNWLFAEVNDENGIQGQGNTNPASMFNNHQVVISGQYYDPSYGIKYANMQEIDDSIDGFYIQGDGAFDEPTVNVDLNVDGDVNDLGVMVYYRLFRKNPPGVNIDRYMGYTNH